VLLADRFEASNGSAAVVAEDVAFNWRLFADVAGGHFFLSHMESARLYLDSGTFSKTATIFPIDRIGFAEVTNSGQKAVNPSLMPDWSAL
jgi:hypothetical protein